MDVVSLQVSAFSYLFASGGYIAAVLWPERWSGRLGPLLLGLAFLFHSVFLSVRLWSAGLVPVTNFTEGLSFFAWLMVGGYLLVQTRYRLAVVGAVVSPLAAALLLAAFLFYGDPESIPVQYRSPWLPFHITLAFLGNAVFALAFAISAIYLLQERLLKSRSPSGLIRRLPALEKLDRLNHELLVWGFPLLTLGIASGGVWAWNMYGAFWSWEPREVLSVVAWLVYAVLLQMRALGGLTGRRAAYGTIFGFGVLLVFYLAVNVLPLAGRHGGGLGS